MQALWCSGREATFAMPVNKRALDIVGGEMTLTEGELLTIGESVVYLVDDRPDSDVTRIGAGADIDDPTIRWSG